MARTFPSDTGAHTPGHREYRKPEVEVSATEARQGRLGKPVLAVLVTGLALAILVWGAVEFWAMSTMPSDPVATVPGASSQQPDQPAGDKAFDDNLPAGEPTETAPVQISPDQR